MFVRFSESENNPIWVSALHVRAVRERRGVFGGHKGGSEIFLGPPHVGTSLSVLEPPADAVGRLTQALMLAHLIVPPDDQPPADIGDGGATAATM